MPSRSPARRPVLRSLALAVSLLAAACQSSGVDDALDVDKGQAASVAAGLETVGSGGVTIGMVTGLAGGGNAAWRDQRNGARLAAKELGGDQITLAIYNARPTAQDVTAAMAALAGKEAKFIVGPARGDLVAAAAAVPAAERPPIVALVANDTARGAGVLAFVSDETDSAIEAAAYAAGAGRKKILLVHAPGAEGPALDRLRKGIEAKGGTVTAALPFPASSMASQGAAIKSAEAVLLAPGLDQPAAALAALRATGALAPAAMILGTPEMRPEAALAGLLMCRVDQLAVGGITERYRAEFGVAMSKEAAYGFDAVALAIGIVRSRGADGLSRSTLSARSGFRGVLGSFRFAANGAVERNCSIYRVEDGKYQLLDPAPEGF